MGDKGKHKETHNDTELKTQSENEEGELMAFEQNPYHKLPANRNHEKTLEDFRSDFIAKINELEQVPNRDRRTNETIKIFRLVLDCITEWELDPTLYHKLCVNHDYEAELEELRYDIIVIIRELEQKQNRDAETKARLATLRKALDCITETKESCSSTFASDE